MPESIWEFNWIFKIDIWHFFENNPESLRLARLGLEIKDK